MRMERVSLVERERERKRDKIIIIIIIISEENDYLNKINEMTNWCECFVKICV